MKSFYIVLLFATSSFSFPSETTTEAPKKAFINIDYNSETTKAPFMATVIRYLSGSSGRREYCGATILHKYWVLTLAKCNLEYGQKMEDVNLENYSIVTGENLLPPDPKASTHEVEEFFLFNSSNNNFYENMLLIKLKMPIEFDEEQQPISISELNDRPNDDDIVEVFGFQKLLNMEVFGSHLTNTSTKVTNVCHDPDENSFFCTKDFEDPSSAITSFLTGSAVVFNENLIGYVVNMFTSRNANVYFNFLSVNNYEPRKWIMNTIQKYIKQ